MPPAQGAASRTPGTARTLAALASGSTPLAVPPTIRSVLPHAELIRSSNVWRMVPTSSRTPNTMPTPSTTPKAVSAARIGRVLSCRTARPSIERSIAITSCSGSGRLGRQVVARLERGEEVDHPLGRAALHLARMAAVAQEDDAVGHRCGGRVVRDHEDCAPLGPVE